MDTKFEDDVPVETEWFLASHQHLIKAFLTFALKIKFNINGANQRVLLKSKGKGHHVNFQRNN